MNAKCVSYLHQMNQQQQEAERLNKDLLEHRAELALLRSALENKEMVRMKTQQ